LKSFIKILFTLFFITHIFVASATTIGVLQYNVKGDGRDSRNNGIWSYLGTNANYPLQTKQINLMANQLLSPSNGVDFIALEQSTVDTTSGAKPNISDLLRNRNITNWGTVKNLNHLTTNDFDEAQIGYSKINWTLINGTTYAGYWNDTRSSDIRPYVMAEFQNNRDSHLKIIFVALHLPHCGIDDATCANNWSGLEDFIHSLKTIEPNTADANVILAGDFNETGLLPKFFTEFSNALNINPLANSPDVNSCCSNDNYSYPLDHVASNIPNVTFVNTMIINDPTVPYPIGLNNDDEEHKAVYTQLVF
jgi:hypothetical protein